MWKDIIISYCVLKVANLENIRICHEFEERIDKSFSYTFIEKIEKSMNLLPVCKLYPTLLARLLMQDKKSMRLNSNVSSQSNRSTELQAKLLPCYGS